MAGKGQGMQFMDDAIWALLQPGLVTPHEAFMKAIDKNRFKKFLPPEDEHLGDAAGAVPDDEQRPKGDFVKRLARGLILRSLARRRADRIARFWRLRLDSDAWIASGEEAGGDLPRTGPITPTLLARRTAKPNRTSEGALSPVAANSDVFSR